MKFVTFVRDDAVHTGALITGVLAPEGDLILDFDDGGSGLPVAAGPLDWADTGAAPFRAAARLVAELDAERVGALAEQGAVVQADAVELLAPILAPEKVICIGLNYQDHAEESGLDVPEWPSSSASSPAASSARACPWFCRPVTTRSTTRRSSAS